MPYWVGRRPAWLAGAGLTAFALGTLELYLRTPGMREEGSPCLRLHLL
jgi:hypothetical protein